GGRRADRWRVLEPALLGGLGVGRNLADLLVPLAVDLRRADELGELPGRVLVLAGPEHADAVDRVRHHGVRAVRRGWERHRGRLVPAERLDLVLQGAEV